MPGVQETRRRPRVPWNQFQTRVSVSHLVWVLGTKPGSSGRVASILKNTEPPLQPLQRAFLEAESSICAEKVGRNLDTKGRF